jgi:hypothetical protein
MRRWSRGSFKRLLVASMGLATRALGQAQDSAMSGTPDPAPMTTRAPETDGPVSWSSTPP